MAGFFQLGNPCIPASICPAPACGPAATGPACIPPQILQCLLQDRDLGSGEQAKNINDVIAKIDKLCAALQKIKRELENLGDNAGAGTSGGNSSASGSAGGPNCGCGIGAPLAAGTPDPAAARHQSPGRMRRVESFIRIQANRSPARE